MCSKQIITILGPDPMLMLSKTVHNVASLIEIKQGFSGPRNHKVMLIITPITFRAIGNTLKSDKKNMKNYQNGVSGVIGVTSVAREKVKPVQMFDQGEACDTVKSILVNNCILTNNGSLDD